MKPELLEKIEAFLDGAITRSQLDEAAGDTKAEVLEEQIQWFRNARTAIEAVGLKEQLKEALPQVQQPEAKVRRLGTARWIMGIAASILVLVVAFWVFNQDSTPALYAEYEYIDPGLPVLMSQSEEHLLYDAFTYYGEGNYSASSEKFRLLLAEYNGSDTVSFYLAASLLYKGQTQEAKSVFEELLQNPESEYYQRTEWMLVLTALRDNKQEEASSLLSPILQQAEHPFFDQATALEADLKPGK
jgi:TolA-binding protein